MENTISCVSTYMVIEDNSGKVLSFHCKTYDAWNSRAKLLYILMSENSLWKEMLC